MNLVEKLAAFPDPVTITEIRETVRKDLEERGARVVVLDDDPTGTQTVHDLPVYTEWSDDVLRHAFHQRDPVFYLSVNSRALAREDAAALGLDVGSRLIHAARACGLQDTQIIPASRSDSTLRGHYPEEVDALFVGLGRTPDGVLIVPAFFEGGRYTIDDVHWVDQDGELVPAHDTEFARDPSFGYTTSNLKEWVEEKTGGRIAAEQVRSVGLEDLRSGDVDRVASILSRAKGGMPIIANAACYEDLEAVVAGLLEVEKSGTTFAYRCAASFVKVRGGIEDRPLLGHDDILPPDGPGVIVVGSYVDKTTRQLGALLDGTDVEAVEVDARHLANQGAHSAEKEIARATAAVDRALSRGTDVAVFTSRKRLSGSQEEFLRAGRSIMDGMCGVLRRTENRAAWVIAKGGITSIEIGKTALDVRCADVLGQIIHGVPVWRLGPDALWPDIPYVVYPGNVGDDGALLHAYQILTGRETKDE